jgi:hypothetical protein
MTKPIIVITGSSGSGKDYFFNSLVYNSRPKTFHKVSFVRPLKRMLEDSFSLDDFALDNKEGKNTQVPAMNCTYIDLLIDFWRAAQHPDNPMSKTLVAVAGNTVKQLWGGNILPVITDLRSSYELSFLYNLKVTEKDFKLIHFHLESDKSYAKPSDSNIEDTRMFMHQFANVSKEYLNTHNGEDSDCIITDMMQTIISCTLGE